MVFLFPVHVCFSSPRSIKPQPQFNLSIPTEEKENGKREERKIHSTFVPHIISSNSSTRKLFLIPVSSRNT
ncbi:hypothetical protein SLEP1_g54318 [Rubroshorea leprosula]|uniref:Uncharacterized protein n=1 Tax=Rubroshorea leprosula TaxID=152421 RepID=A0AAV5MDZ8_9ROSI|nr:hypothetical protein SLEP1_g54318 [Rubroshorea leprosula]